MKLLRQTIEGLVVESAAAARPPERLTVAEAAEQYRYLNNPGAYVGPYLNDTVPYLREPMEMFTSREYIAAVFCGPAQSAKSLALDTPVPTPSGWTTMGALTIGDWVFGSTGSPVQVVLVQPVQQDHVCYEVEFDDGSKIVADAGHEWAVRNCVSDWQRVVTTQDMVDAGVRQGKRARFAVATAGALELPERDDLLLDPYVLGAWIGGGSELNGDIAVGREDLDTMVEQLSLRGYKSRVYKPSALHRCFDLGVSVPDLVWIDRYLFTMGLGSGMEKRIPPEYLRASEGQRRELLRGICDTDGTLCGVHNRSVSITTVDPILRDQYIELARSFGYKVRSRFAPNDYNGSWQVLFTIYSGDEAFSFPRKISLVSKTAPARPGETGYRFVQSITRVPSVPVRCIGVDSEDHLFLAGEAMVPTHNTEMFLNWLAYSVRCDPADMMLVQTSQTTARDFSMRRVDRMHRHSPKVGSYLADGKSSDNTFDKHYRAGMMLSLSWPTINELSGKPIPRQFLTDFDRMPEDVDGEGNAFDLTAKRGTTFGRNRMTVAESSPGFAVQNPKWTRKSAHEAPPTKGILGLYNRGDRRRWYWDCVNCHNKFEPDFSLLNWPDSNDMMESAERAVMVCPHCAQEYNHDPRHGLPGKHEMNRNGRWVRDGMTWGRDGQFTGTPFRSNIASFWLKGPAAAFASWETLVFNWLSANKDYENSGSEESLKTTVNTDQGDAYTPKSLANDRVPEAIKAQAKPLGFRVVPAAVRFLIAAIDVQKNRFVVQIHGVALNGDIYVVDRFEIKKSKRADDVAGGMSWVNPGAFPEDWKLLSEQVINLSYPLGDGSGRHMAVKLTLCDSGGKAGVTSNAYDFVRWLRFGDADDGETDRTASTDEGTYDWKPGMAGRFVLVKGASSKSHPRVKLDYPDSQRSDRHAGARGEIPVLFMNTNTLKDMVDNRLDRNAAGGRFVFPDWLDDNFFIELTVEVKDAAKGWINPKNYRNESWDLLAYCMAGTLTQGINLEYMDPENPPNWAEAWDQNDMVFNPVEKKTPYEGKKKSGSTLAKLAGNLA